MRRKGSVPEMEEGSDVRGWRWEKVYSARDFDRGNRCSKGRRLRARYLSGRGNAERKLA